MNIEDLFIQKCFQETIEDFLLGTGRAGIDNVIEQLRIGGFFSAPASVGFHNNFEGGLAKHSLEVYQKAIELYNELKSSGVELPFDENTVTLCSLLHDVCKMDEYVMINARPMRTKAFNENKKKLHGTKSVDILKSWGLELTDEEIKAIHWHMGDWAKNAPKIYGHSFSVAEEQSILVKLIHNADSIAASEANNKNKNNQVEDKATPHIIKDGVLPKGYKPIVMSNVEEYLRSQGGIDTQELLDIINKYT